MPTTNLQLLLSSSSLSAEMLLNSIVPSNLPKTMPEALQSVPQSVESKRGRTAVWMHLRMPVQSSLLRLESLHETALLNKETFLRHPKTNFISVSIAIGQSANFFSLPPDVQPNTSQSKFSVRKHQIHLQHELLHLFESLLLLALHSITTVLLPQGLLSETNSLLPEANRLLSASTSEDLQRFHPEDRLQSLRNLHSTVPVQRMLRSGQPLRSHLPAVCNTRKQAHQEMRQRMYKKQTISRRVRSPVTWCDWLMNE